MNMIALITCLEHENPLFVTLKDELNNRLNPAKTLHEVFHKAQTSAEIVNALKAGDPRVPVEIGFDFSCNIARIGLTMRFIRKELPDYKIKYYYRKEGDEALPASLQKFACFKTLMEKHKELLMA